MSTKAIAAQVKSERTAADMTQAQLAELSGVPLATLRKIEQGKTEDPRLSTITAILGAIRSYERPATTASPR